MEQGDDLIAVNARHANALRQAVESLQAAATRLGSGFQADEFLASDLRYALSCYGEISGTVENERVLDRIFETFCIGK